MVVSLAEACNANEGDDPGGRQRNACSADYARDPKANDSNPSEARYGVSFGIVEGAPVQRSHGECVTPG